MPSKYGFGNKRKSSPYNKNVKPDYPDIDGDGNRKESMKQAAADKKSPMNMNGDPKKANVRKMMRSKGNQGKPKTDPNISPSTGLYYPKPGGAEGNKKKRSPMNMKHKSDSPMAKYKSDAQRKAVHASKNEKSPMNMMGKGPKQEGNRGKGTGYAK
tara:strand:- start:167 stop:634 length:468 start_codon:yes stop_codon:yes gene_type:complete